MSLQEQINCAVQRFVQEYSKTGKPKPWGDESDKNPMIPCPYCNGSGVRPLRLVPRVQMQVCDKCDVFSFDGATVRGLMYEKNNTYNGESWQQGKHV